jgi:Ca2+-binding RTX toxin-like protein
MQREGEGSVVRQGHCIALVGVLLIGCAVLLVIGCTGVRSGAPQKEQARSPEATASEEARCEGTRSIEQQPKKRLQGEGYVTNDLPGCPKGGLLSGTEKDDKLDGEDGDDQIRGLGAMDVIFGGLGSDVIYGGEGDDGLQGDVFCCSQTYRSKDVLYGGPGKDSLEDFDGGDDVLYGGDGDDKLLGGKGEDVIYGGDGNDRIDGATVDLTGVVVKKQRDELYCGEGKDHYIADKLDYVDSSCEVGGRISSAANA